MNYCLVGLSHKTTPIELREKLAIPDSRVPEALLRLHDQPGITDALIVSTCNRVEFLVRSEEPSFDLRSFVLRYFDIEGEKLASHLYEYRAHDAVRQAMQGLYRRGVHGTRGITRDSTRARGMGRDRRPQG